MMLLVLCMVGDVCEQNGIVKNVRVDNWTAKLTVIASCERSRPNNYIRLHRNIHELELIFVFPINNAHLKLTSPISG